MPTLMATGQLLAAEEDLVLRYQLLPYGEEGSTNLGKLTASQGSVALPADPTGLPVNMEHDYKRPVGFFQAVQETATGLECSVKLLDTTAGRDAYLEAKTGARKAISIEVENPVIRAGKLLAGILSGAGLVVKPAYKSATLLAADAGELADQAQALADASQALATALKPSDDDDTDDTTTPIEAKDNTVPAPTIQAAAPGAAANILQAGQQLQAAPADSRTEVQKLAATLAGLGNTTSPTLMAANLDTITQADVYDKVSAPAYVGELWKGRQYISRFQPLVTAAELTSQVVTGWEWVPGFTPAVGDWTPFSGTAPNEVMNDVPTNEVKAMQVSYNAARLAGGHRVDRIHTDLPTPGFWESYLQESTDDFARKLDAKVLAHIQANATAKTAAGSDAASAWSRLVFAASWVLDYSVPTYAIVGNDLYRELLNTTALENLAMLNSSLGLEEGTLANFKIIGAPISNTALNGKVIVGNGAATHCHTLPGGPVRVDGVEVQKGAMDHGVFGYYLLRTADARGIISA